MHSGAWMVIVKLHFGYELLIEKTNDVRRLKGSREQTGCPLAGKREVRRAEVARSGFDQCLRLRTSHEADPLKAYGLRLTATQLNLDRLIRCRRRALDRNAAYSHILSSHLIARVPTRRMCESTTG